MSIIALQQLGQYIYEFCGIDYLKNLPSLESKITNRIKELELSIWEYCRYIKMEEKERDVLVELITVNETFFFREENFLKELQDNIFPQYKDYSKEKPLRIWCSACSSGEEPYTIAMLLKETMLFEKESVEIVASDINKKVLSKAKKGLYNSKSLSFRKMPNGMLEKYFDLIENDYKVKDEIMDWVKFKHLNMFDKKIYEEIGKVDIILCRNVLIYFDTDSIKKAVSSFYNILNIPGYLFLGHAETVTNVNPGFNTIYTPSIFYYKKGENQ